ncbi:MAG: hypothetical protein HUU22_14485 [Phycisphaerae bacterium]|nr:hypothetical protein [Phycisphaerae bacterium]NUQ47228.1 hypothetical protein [Phycisphaerae bacterium]
MRPPFQLGSLPLAGKIILTAFLALIGFGYLAALGNLYQRHQLADGRSGLSFDDLRAVFHGLNVAASVADDVAAARPRAPQSRMLEQIEPGGDMRKHLLKGGDASVRALTAWLEAGAIDDEFDRESLMNEGDPAPRAVIERQCLNCHNADGGENEDAPFGPDAFEASYDLVRVYAAPGTAHTPDSAASGRPASASGRRTIGPQALAHLTLVTHIHMLSIPVFTLIVGGFFLLTGPARGWRGVVAAVPMTALVFDFASWWLARQIEPMIFVMVSAGALYGVAMAVQLLTVTAAIWSRRVAPAFDDSPRPTA